MRDRVGQLVSIALMSVIAAASWLVSEFVAKNWSTEISEVDQGPTSIVIAAVISRAGPGGDAEQSISASRIEHFADGRSALTDPSLSQHKRDFAAVRATAERGKVSADQKSIDLSGSVRLYREEFKGSAATTVLTEELKYLVDDELARTDQPVRVLRGKYELNGMGMIANQKTGQLEVLSNSRMTVSGDAPARGLEAEAKR